MFASCAGLLPRKVANLALAKTLRAATFDLVRSENPELMFRGDLPEGRKQIARTLLTEASIEVTSALLMSDEIDALPVGDDNT